MNDDSETTPNRRLARAQRITSPLAFAAVYSQARSWRGRCMVLWLGTGTGAALRLGVVASRKVGNAVQRARAKRRLRAAYRLSRGRLHGNGDVILIARRGILFAEWREVIQELLDLAGKAGLCR